MLTFVRRRRSLAVSLMAAAAVVAGACVPDAPPVSVPETDPPPADGTPLEPAHLDCARWRYDGVEPGPLPPEYDEDGYMESSERDPAGARSPQRQCGQLGAAVDLAWGLERGRPDVVIAVLDSGVKWRDEGVVADLGDNAYLNRGELPAPQGPAAAAAAERGDPYDLNGDGRFSVGDYVDDPRVSDRNDNGVLDPEDLILTPSFNNGVDDDANGYVDDLSGWDFLNNDNNPNDDVDYGHGTGEARDAAALHDGEGDYGWCAECTHLPIRVSDSFMAEGGRFAAGVLFALDSGAAVVLDALGAVSNPPQAQQAVDAAYRRGVPIMASMADEQSQHANLPAAMNHTIPVNSVTESMRFLGDLGRLATGARDTLALNGCTNHGGIAWVSVPSDGCSSEATGNAAGMAGLLVSAARNAGVTLTSSEIAQLIRSTADDVDFSTPNHVDPANNTTDDFGQQRYPTVKGWDATHGYGRVNVYELVAALQRGDIPPEAEIRGPRWFDLLPASGTVPIEGHVAANRSTSYSYRVEWATGLQAPAHPAADTWNVIAERSGLSAPVDGPLATLDLAQVAAALPDGARGVPLGVDGKPDHDRFTARIRVVVTDAQGRVATTLRHVSVHDDPSLIAAEHVAGAGASSPVFADVDGDGVDEMVLTTDEGFVHVRRPDGSELPGFPVRTPDASYWSTTSPTVRSEQIATPGASIGIGAPAVADLDGDGVTEIVVADYDGGVHSWSADGSQKFSTRIDPVFSQESSTDARNRVKRSIAGAPALGDLDGDGDLETVISAMDRHVYAWNHDGTLVAGFPVLIVDPAKVAAIDPETHHVTFADESRTGIGGELIATPAIADLDGDGRDDIVIGAQEQYDETVAALPPLGVPGGSGNTRLYAVSGAGTTAAGARPGAVHPAAHAYLPGWPVALPMAMTDVLPTIGGGVSLQAAIGDVDGDGAVEVVASSISGPTRVFEAGGRSAYHPGSGLPTTLDWFFSAGWGTNSVDKDALLAAFGGPSIGRFGDPEGAGLDIAAPTSGAGRALDTLFSNSQVGDPHLTVWSGRDAKVRPAFPRVTADIAFFVTPAMADVDGDGRNEVVAGNGLQMVDAFRSDGTQSPGWPKLTGGWVVGTPAMGDWDGDGVAEIATVRRDGVLLVWGTPTGADATGDWPRYGADGRNSGLVTVPGTPRP